MDNLDELISAARQFTQEETPAEEDARSELSAFLDRAALDAGDNQAEEYEDAVQLMTLHSAKGLEFPLVVLAGMEEGYFHIKCRWTAPKVWRKNAAWPMLALRGPWSSWC